MLTITNTSVLALARHAKGLAFREIYGLRFGQFVSVCNERVQASSEVNTNALATSPFNAAYLLEALHKRDSTMTTESMRDMIARQRVNFLAGLDELPPEQRLAFCNSLPKLIADAAGEVPR